MTESPAGRRRPGFVPLPVRTAAADVVVQAVLIGGAWLLVARLDSGPVVVERGVAVLAFAAGVAATILLCVGAWMSAGRARHVAVAVGLYTGTDLLLRTLDAGSRGLTVLLGSVAVVGVAGLLLLALRPARTLAPGLAVVAGVGGAGLVITGTDALLPHLALPLPAAVLADLVAWTAAGGAGVLLVVAGATGNRPLLRRVGLAFATLAAAHAGRLAGDVVVVGALELAALMMLLVAAVPFLLSAVRGVVGQQEASRARLAEAEAVLTGLAERDHELRNVVAGLSGAAKVLTRPHSTESIDGRLLLVAAGAELERLQRMLEGQRNRATTAEAAVADVLRDLAAVHRANGLDVRLNVEGMPVAALDPGTLAQVLTNLLVNCARHAPGARVWLRARQAGERVRVEVADDGPGLPPGATAALLRRGVRGPGSTGDGLGLAIATEMVESSGGRLSVLSGGRADGRGCTVVLDLPLAAWAAPAEALRR